MTDERTESNVPISKELLERIGGMKWMDHEMSQKFRVHELLEEAILNRATATTKLDVGTK